MKKIVLALVMVAGIGMVSCKSNKTEEGTETTADTATVVTDTVITTPAGTTTVTDTTTVITDSIPK
ncbi:hypothetical protein [Flavobacterium psychrotrophum]|uniref:hypothetical protein n=1 Tax=Flavobacterium psychrotrophum TaxID=2294119 RepID=UPI000E31B41C|nr:hypothetical protein [Flavobacterium psychrotrophum]